MQHLQEFPVCEWRLCPPSIYVSVPVSRPIARTRQLHGQGRRDESHSPSRDQRDQRNPHKLEAGLDVGEQGKLASGGLRCRAIGHEKERKEARRHLVFTGPLAVNGA